MLDVTSRKEIGYLVISEMILLAVMLAVFLVFGYFSLPVLTGGLVGTAVSVLNFVLMCVSLTKAVKDEDEKHRTTYIRMSQSLRLLLMFAVVIVAVAVLKTNLVATLIPLLFPRIHAIVRNIVLKKEEEKLEKDNEQNS